MEASPRPWSVNGHSIEADDENLWQQNDKTGKGVVALLPSAPKFRFKKAERKEWDDLTAANADLIVTAVNSFKGKRNLDRFNTGDPEHDCNCALGTYCMETADPATGEPVMLMGAFARWLFSKQEEKLNEHERLARDNKITPTGEVTWVREVSSTCPPSVINNTQTYTSMGGNNEH